jgi:hypothetical protein
MKVGFRLGLMVGLLALGTSARADDEKIPVKDLPKAVVDAVKRRFPKAEMTEAKKVTENGMMTYAIAFKDGAKMVEAGLTFDGKFLLIETEVTITSLPAKVTAAIRAKYPNGTLESAAWVLDYEDGKESKYYAVVVSTGEKKDRELDVTTDGKIQSDVEAEDE